MRAPGRLRCTSGQQPAVPGQAVPPRAAARSTGRSAFRCGDASSLPCPMAKQAESPTILLVPHTHWDREWYRPFQSFRVSLVEVVDEVLELLEGDERWRFTLDGQLATVDDYVEIRPEGEERIRALVESGRLAVGPWQTLMDEFLVSGETIVRNLETGLARAEDVGGAM